MKTNLPLWRTDAARSDEFGRRSQSDKSDDRRQTILSLSPLRIFSNAAKIISTHQRRGPSPLLKRGPNGPIGLRVHNNHFWDVYFQMLKPTINFLSILNRNLRILELRKPNHEQVGWSNSNQRQINVVYRMKNDPKEKSCYLPAVVTPLAVRNTCHLGKKFISSSFTSMIRDSHHLFKTFTRNSGRSLGFPLFRNLFSEMTIGDKRKEIRCR